MGFFREYMAIIAHLYPDTEPTCGHSYYLANFSKLLQKRAYRLYLFFDYKTP